MKKPTSNNGPASDDNPPTKGEPGKPNKPKAKPKAKPNWVNTFRCFHCGKHGHNLPKCSQCGQAYYCNADCVPEQSNFHQPMSMLYEAAEFAAAELSSEAVRFGGERGGGSVGAAKGTKAF